MKIVQNRRLRLALVALAATALSACATVRTAPLAMPDANGGPLAIEPGITYFLPQQLVRITAERSDSSLGKKAKALAEAEAALVIQQTALAEAQAALAGVRQTYVTSTATGERLRELQVMVSAAQARVEQVQRQVVTAETAQSTASTQLRTVLAEQQQSGAPLADQEVEVEIALLPPSADTDFAFRLTPVHSSLRNYDHNFVVGRNGLLTSADTVVTDRTGDFLVQLATIAGAVSAGAASTEGALVRESVNCANDPDALNLVLDFSERSEVARLNRQLRCFGVRFVHDQQADPHWGEAYTRASVLPASGAPLDGIVYRTPVEVIVQMQRCSDQTTLCMTDDDNAGWQTVETFVMALPQAGPIAYIEQDAGPLTRTAYALKFDNGILTSYDGERPGELPELASLPLRAVGGFIDGATRIFTGRSTLAQQELTAINAEAALARADIANLTQTLTAMQAQQNAQQGLSLSAITDETALMAAMLAQQNTDASLARNNSANETLMMTALLAQLNAQNQLALGQTNAPQQLAQAQYQATINRLLIEQRTRELTECIAEQQAAATPDYSVCVPAG